MHTFAILNKRTGGQCSLPYMYEVNVNFERDWFEYLCRQLEAAGYTPNRLLGVREITYQFFNIGRRLISAVPRRILKSDVFSCPDNLKHGLELLEEKILNGLSTVPHLSRNTKSLSETDMLLNDWGIQHLHLGTTLMNDGFINRTGPVLFARFDDNYAYFICIMEHGKGHYPWARKDMVNIIHRNWPESIKSYLMNGISSMEQPLSDDDIKSLRDSGLSTLTEVAPGFIYRPIGGGYSTAKTSVEARIQSDHWLYAIRFYEKLLRDNIANIVNALHEKTGTMIGPQIKLSLSIQGLNIYALDVKNQLLIKLGNILEAGSRRAIMITIIPLRPSTTFMRQLTITVIISKF